VAKGSSPWLHDIHRTATGPAARARYVRSASGDTHGEEAAHAWFKAHEQMPMHHAADCPMAENGGAGGQDSLRLGHPSSLSARHYDAPVIGGERAVPQDEVRIEGISAVTLGVRDMAASVRFYAGAGVRGAVRRGAGLVYRRWRRDELPETSSCAARMSIEAGGGASSCTCRTSMRCTRERGRRDCSPRRRLETRNGASATSTSSTRTVTS